MDSLDEEAGMKVTELVQDSVSLLKWVGFRKSIGGVDPFTCAVLGTPATLSLFIAGIEERAEKALSMLVNVPIATWDSGSPL